VTPPGGLTLDPNASRPMRLLQWNLTLQREVGRTIVVEAGYVANRGEVPAEAAPGTRLDIGHTLQDNQSSFTEIREGIRMPIDYPKQMKTTVMEVNSKLHALLDLFGSREHVTEDLEVLYGITSRAEFELVATQLQAINTQLAQATAATTTLYKNAKLVARTAAVHS